MLIISKLIYRLSALAFIITIGFLMDIDKIILKFICKKKDPSINQDTLKGEQGMGSSLTKYQDLS